MRWKVNQLLRLATISVLIIGSLETVSAQKDASAVGKWKGESLCTVKPSACHDEVVVYEITAATGKKDALVWKADKIVNGEQQNMGTMDCTYAPKSQVMTCDMPGRGVWKLTVHGDAMTGTLELSDGTLFRKVSVKRSM
jgi:hypothetical protein